MLFFEWLKKYFEKLKNGRNIEYVTSLYLEDINKIQNDITRGYMVRVLWAARAILNHVLFNAPEEYNLRKPIDNKEIKLWYQKTMLAIIGYSMHMLGVQNMDDQRKYNEYWGMIINEYNKIFATSAGLQDANKYAVGLAGQDLAPNPYEFSEGLQGSMIRDAATISKELLGNIWNEHVDNNSIEEYIKMVNEAVFREGLGKGTDFPMTTRKALTIGHWIWKSYQHYVQPYIKEAMKADIDSYLAERVEFEQKSEEWKNILKQYASETKRIKILVIDDEPSILESVEMILKIVDVDIIKAPDGETGLGMLTPDIDMVFTDLKMPGIDGLEVLKRIKNIYPFIPVIIITAYATESSHAMAMQFGALEYLRKPFIMDDIYELINRGLVWRARMKNTNKNGDVRMKKKKIGKIGEYGMPYDGYEVLFVDGTKDYFSDTQREVLSHKRSEAMEVEFVNGSYLLDKEDIEKLQNLKSNN